MWSRKLRAGVWVIGFTRGCEGLIGRGMCARVVESAAPHLYLKLLAYLSLAQVTWRQSEVFFTVPVFSTVGTSIFCVPVMRILNQLASRTIASRQ